MLSGGSAGAALDDDVASSGVEPLDAVLGGLFWGDNVVWEVAEPGAADPFYSAAAAAHGSDGLIHVRLREREPPATGGDVLDARPGQAYAQPASLLRAIAARCQAGDRSLLLFDGLDAMAERWSPEVAAKFFATCCPQLLAIGAIAYWTMPAGRRNSELRRTVEEITQCVFFVGEDRVRVAKADGRPPSVEGTVFRLRVERGRPQLTPAPMAARIGTGLRAARVKRHLSQSDLARLIGVSPSSISQAERGQSGLSLETLLQLAGKLGMTIDELLRGELATGCRLGRRDHPPLGRATDQTEPIALLDDPEVGLRAYLVRIPARATAKPHQAHKGLELVAVANGLVQVLLATSRPVLRAGEVVLAEDAPVTGWRNLGVAEAAVFWVLRDARRVEQ